jgi:hypothetical protein
MGENDPEQPHVPQESGHVGNAPVSRRSDFRPTSLEAVA